MNGETATPPALTENGQGQTQEITRYKRTAPTKILPSDRLAFDKQLAALRAYAVAFESNGGRPVKNAEAGGILDMSENTIVVTNAFFCEAKLLARQRDEQAFVPSAEAIAYFKAHEWDPSTAGEKLKPAFERMWCSEVLVPRLKFRAYEQREALAVLAEASNSVKDYEERLQVLLEYLVLSGVVTRDGDLIKSAAPRSPSEAKTETPTASEAAPQKVEAPAVEEGCDSYTLVLDPRSKRKVIIQAPHVITSKELERIRTWLGVQLIVEDVEDAK
jgi:hypothetical protein